MSSQWAVMRVRADPADIAKARSFVRSRLAPHVGEALSGDVVLVVSELVSNAVEHGSGDDVKIRLTWDEREVELVVSSAAIQLPQLDADPVAADELRGRGLRIVMALADAVAVSATAGNVSVSCRFHDRD